MREIQGVKYGWHLHAFPPQQVLALAAQYALAPAIAQAILARGHISPQAIEKYLFSSFAEDVAHPSLLYDADKAVERLLRAIEKKEKILIAGDYDVDGITASALMILCLQPLGAYINFFLPNRVKDGYGLSAKTIERAVQSGYRLVVTVDNGITSFGPAQRARELGIDLIITDHHRSHGTLPDAFAIVNPNQEGCSYPYKALAGVGVIFKVMSLLYEKVGRQLPAKAYELLLLGTVADVVPLTGENRYWVRHGLTQINQHSSLSFNVLKTNGKLSKSRISSTDIGFSIAPQINALGRLEDPRQGVQFLLDANVGQVERIGKTLFELNQARKEIERGVLKDVIAQVESGAIDLKSERIIMAASDSWPPGVIGLVAGRLVGMYGRPAILLHTKNGIAKGSCRSIPAFNMFDALQASSDLLTTFGGHPQAAGLSLPVSSLQQLKERMEGRAAEFLTEKDLKQKLMVESEITLSECTQKLVDDMRHLEPFGCQNPEPLFYVRGAVLVEKPTLLKEAHIKLKLFHDGATRSAIFFNRPELYAWFAERDEPFDVVGQVKENHWQDTVSIELTGLDVAPTS